MRTSLSRRDDVVRRFADGCRRGDLDELRATLDTAAIAVCDSGGALPAIGPVHGAEHVAELVAAVLCGRPDTELTTEAVNGHAGLALRRAGRAIAVVAVETAGTGITALWIMLNPAKLHRWHGAWPVKG